MKLSESKRALANRLSLFLLHSPTKGSFIEQWAHAFGDFYPVRPHHNVFTDEQKAELEKKEIDPELKDRLINRSGLPSHHMIITMKEGGDLSAIWVENRDEMDERIGWREGTAEVLFPDKDDPDRPVTVRDVVKWVVKHFQNLK